MRTVGLTGGIACGKSTVARLLVARGVAVIDADQLARQVVEPGQPALAEIVARFGEGVLQPDGTLDRKALGAIVFADPAARQDLEAITHPAIRGRTVGFLMAQAEAGAVAAVVEAALLVETRSHGLYDELIVVGCSPQIQRTRLLARDGFTEAEAEQRLAAQLPLADKRAVATEYISNDGDEAELMAAVEQAWTRILDRAARPPTDRQ